MQEARQLARSVKEHERRQGHTLGFDRSEPGDCLAFKYYRDVGVSTCRTVNLTVSSATSQEFQESPCDRV